MGAPCRQKHRRFDRALLNILLYCFSYHKSALVERQAIMSANNSLKPLLLRRSDAIASLLGNGSTSFLWKLRRHWLKALLQHQIAGVIKAPAAFVKSIGSKWNYQCQRSFEMGSATTASRHQGVDSPSRHPGSANWTRFIAKREPYCTHTKHRNCIFPFLPLFSPESRWRQAQRFATSLG